jgi:hypothetical protein
MWRDKRYYVYILTNPYIESKNPKWDDLSGEWGKPRTFRFTPPSAWIPRCARDGKS